MFTPKSFPPIRRKRFRFGMDGPNAWSVFEEAAGGSVPDIKFFNTARVQIAGVEVVALRHGMAGHKGVELSGYFAQLETVKAELRVGRKWDLKQGGIGTELELLWGEPDGGSRKPQVERHAQTRIRVTVAPAPYPQAVQSMKRA